MKRIGFVVVTLLLQLAVGEDLYWLRNSNWDEPSNWRLGRLPCGQEVTTFAKVSLAPFSFTIISILHIAL